MRVAIWITEGGWEAAVDAALELPAASYALLHVPDRDVAAGASGAVAGLLGRRGARVVEALEDAVSSASTELLESARERLAAGLGDDAEGVEVTAEAQTGPPEIAVMEAARAADALVIARSNRKHGPGSISRPMRYVVDHAPGRLVVAWPGGGPEGPAPEPPPHVTGDGPPPEPLPHEREESEGEDRGRGKGRDRPPRRG